MMKRAIQNLSILTALLLLFPTAASAITEESESTAADYETITEISSPDTQAPEQETPEEDVPSETDQEQEPAEEIPPLETTQEITVSFQDGETVLLTLTLPAGTAPNQVPAEGAEGGVILGWVADGRKVSNPAALTLTEDTVFTVWNPPALNTQEHIPYISGKGNGQFAPNQNLTRAEAASMLCTLLADPVTGACRDTFSDVSSDAWYYTSIKTLAGLGIVGGYENGTFQPQKTITRAEFVTILSAFYPLETGSSAGFSDVPAEHWASGSIRSAAAKGWVNGYSDGTFQPDRTITRAQAVTALNAVLGRSAAASETTAMIQENGICIFTDVRPSDWYYAAVMESSIPHGFTAENGGEIWETFAYKSCGYDAGFQKIGDAYYIVDENQQITFQTPGIQTINEKLYYVDQNGAIPAYAKGPQEIGASLYCVNEDGSLLTNGTEGYLTFGPDGRYTSGNAEIDALVIKTLASCIQEGMTRDERLRAAYLYLRENTRYLPRAHHGRGTTDWCEESAIFMFKNLRGNCYCYAAAFMYMARQLGYQAESISGGLGRSNDDHAWVMIGDKVFDPELEYAYLHRFSYSRYYNLYNISPVGAPFYYHFP